MSVLISGVVPTSTIALTLTPIKKKQNTKLKKIRNNFCKIIITALKLDRKKRYTCKTCLKIELTILDIALDKKRN